ncbi:MAG: glycosyltransferase [Patescibacteria group bacterium]
MISIIITSKNEPQTIDRAVRSFLNENFCGHNFEILVVSPDKKTQQAAKKADPINVKILEDKDQGKPAALNLAIKQSRGDILIFSDGDVRIGRGAVSQLLDNFKTGIATGRPVVEEHTSRNKFIFWQKCLFDTAHKLRESRNKKCQFILLSGYLFAVKKEFLQNFKFPTNILTEDEYLSYFFWSKGHRIFYAENAKVYVKFAANYSDWINQKVRTLGGSYQIPHKWKKGIAMRSFLKESARGFFILKDYGNNFKDAYWLILLILARLHGWLKAFFKVKILKEKRESLWIRIGSTK